MYGFITNGLETWASFFSNHAAVRTAIDFLHVGGLLGGGGCAIAADRMTLGALRIGPDARHAQLQAVRGTHRVVLAGLAAVIFSGMLLFFSDTGTYLYSKMFWIKMGLVVLLMVNGVLLVGAERQAERSDDRGWLRLKWTSIASLALWFLTTLAGTALPNIS